MKINYTARPDIALSDFNHERLDVKFGGHSKEFASTIIDDLIRDSVASRLAQEDCTLWGKKAREGASSSLGWVKSHKKTGEIVEEVLALREELRRQGITRYVLAGIGGSSLPAEVIAQCYKAPLVVADSTSPGQILASLKGDLGKTALIISSKSGATIETEAVKRVFEAAFALAEVDASKNVIVVTDPGSPLETEAKKRGYRLFLSDPTVGGRYSVFTYFGLLPAGLAGADIKTFIEETRDIDEIFSHDSLNNPALVAAAAIAATGSEKMGLISCNGLYNLTEWVEQIIAESTGKKGTGVLPFVLRENSAETTFGQKSFLIARLEKALKDREPKDNEIIVRAPLGVQFLFWEHVAAFVGRIFKINPFDQPDVESVKIATRQILMEKPRVMQPLFSESGIEVRTNDRSITEGMTLRSALENLWRNIDPNGYVAIQAYVNRYQHGHLRDIRDLIAMISKMPTSFGWGPRFQHSTGQYYKGGPKRGVFLQILEKSAQDLLIPGVSYSFEELIHAQANGEASVLASKGKPVLSLTIADPNVDIVEILTKSLTQRDF